MKTLPPFFQVTRSFLAPLALVLTGGFSLHSQETADRQIPGSDDAERRSANVETAANEIAFFLRRLENLRKEEQAWREKSAPAEELAALSARIAESEAKLKEWEDHRAHGTLPARSAPKPTHDSPKDLPTVERLRELRDSIETLRAAGRLEQAHELSVKAAAIEREIQGSNQPATTKVGDGDGGHGNVAIYTERGRYQAGYSKETPKPPTEWVQPLKNDEPALSLFEKRILPIFNSPKASSCTECHLGGVELKDYIFPSQEKTFAALLKGKMVDLENPDSSKILEFISRRPEKASLVNDRVRQEEFEAFRSWIHAAVKDPQLLAAKAEGLTSGPSLPPEVIRHARTDRILASFVENVWSEMNRCSSCHSPETNQKQVERHGDLMSWIVPDDPMATLRYLNEEGLIDVDHPEKSSLITKPTLQTKHKGGRKMLTGDRSYKQFLAFVRDYAAMVRGDYTAADQLPEVPDLIPTPVPIILRVTGVPQRYADKPMKVDVYSLTEAGPSPHPVATATWPVIAKNLMWQFKLTLLTPRDEMPESGPRIAPGRYLAKIYIDDLGRLEKEPMAELGEAEFMGQVEFRSQWKPTVQNVTVIAYPRAAVAAVD